MRYDVAVIGGGVVGCAVLRGFALAGARAVLLERDADLLAGASKGNSGLLHTGFDATPGTLEAACVQAGNAEYRAIREPLNLPLIETGALVVAWTEDEARQLAAIASKAAANGIAVTPLTAAEAQAREPNLAPTVRAALHVPGEAVIDPWSAPLAYALQALANGAEIRRGVEVRGGDFDGSAWRLATEAGPVEARVVLNCAGNRGDLVEAIARPPPFRIRPRKGQFVVFDKTAYALVSSIILPVPTERTKGVVLCRTAYGNLLIGPTAEDQEEREVATVEEASLRGLIAAAVRIAPAVAAHPVTAVYAGLRPATEFKDYQIAALPDRNWITVAGIRSTGLSGALGIAQHVRAVHERHFGGFGGCANPAWTPVPNLAETRERPYQKPGRGPVICHCEQVTEGEIRAALAGPLAAATLGGLKRRTRCMMGRCQGFYCMRRVMELAAGQIREFAAA
jgi:glycerol-3-phosphate dehydrogenase